MACWRRITPSPRPQESRGASRLTGLSQRREAAIEQALKAKIEQRRAAREAQAAADRRELEAFKEQFLNAAREVFALIDADGNGSLTKTEIVDAVTHDKARTRRPTTARTSTCEDSVICGTAVFVCLVCGGAGSSNDRFTLRFHRRKLLRS